MSGDKVAGLIQLALWLGFLAWIVWLWHIRNR